MGDKYTRQAVLASLMAYEWGEGSVQRAKLR